jgi:hypothetical protein
VESLVGISGCKVGLVNADSLWVLFSEFEGASVPVTRENILSHEAVVRSVLDNTTPLPFRFGTLVTEEQLRSYLSARADALADKFRSVHGCVEMSVKAIWPKSAVLGHQPDSETEETEKHRVTAGLKGPGAAFLVAKGREILGEKALSESAKEVASWLSHLVVGLTRAEHTTLRPNERLVLAAAHLVERGCLGRYKEQLKRGREARPELHFLISGPWPPYTFANIDLEFKTHFGVS